MIELKLNGNYYEIGCQLGRQIDSFRSSFFSNKFTKGQLEFAEECEIIVKKFFPEILQEIQGIADSSNIDYENLIVSELSGGLNHCCTVLAIPPKYTKKNKMLFARSMDWFKEALPFAFIFSTKPDKKLASFAFSETLIGRFGGINESGLVIGESNCVWRNFNPGLIPGILIRWIFENCKTVQEAVDFLEKIPHVIGNNYLIADTNHTVARVEAYDRTIVTTYFQDDFTAIANHYFSSSFDFIAARKPKHSIDRINYLDNWINKISTPITIDSVKEIQRTHEVELCPHVQEYYNQHLMNLTTCWAWIHEVGTKTLHLCIGSPCKNEYKEYRF